MFRIDEYDGMIWKIWSIRLLPFVRAGGIAVFAQRCGTFSFIRKDSFVDSGL
jgi:hypothetical protein